MQKSDPFRCPTCRQVLPASARFCRRCGANVAGAPTKPAPGAPLKSTPPSLPQSQATRPPAPARKPGASPWVAMFLLLIGLAAIWLMSAVVYSVHRNVSTYTPPTIPVPAIPATPAVPMPPNWPQIPNAPKLGSWPPAPPGSVYTLGNGLPAECSKTAILGGPGGTPFVNVAIPVRAVVGFRWQMGTWNGRLCLRRFDPLYEIPTGPPPIGFSDVLARNGYVITGLHVVNDTDPTANVIALRVIFMRNDNGRLIPTDYYESAWIGNPTAGTAPQLLAGNRFVVGTCGRQRMNLDALGLVVTDLVSPSSR